LNLAVARYSEILTYALITAAMIFGSALGTLVWVSQASETYQLRDAMVFGAAFPLIFKKGIGAATERTELHLGEAPTTEVASESITSRYFT
jgi:hypothetical protein